MTLWALFGHPGRVKLAENKDVESGSRKKCRRVQSNFHKLSRFATGTNYYIYLRAVTDGIWHTIKRNLASDLLKGTGATLDHIASIVVSGNLSMDNLAFYPSYGVLGEEIDEHRFTGKELDEETGLVYFGARYYDSEVGRFTTVDPAEDGENWYAYCSENPIRYIDLNGKWDGDWHYNFTWGAVLQSTLFSDFGNRELGIIDSIVKWDVRTDTNITTGVNCPGRHQNTFDLANWCGVNARAFFQGRKLNDDINKDSCTFLITSQIPEYQRLVANYFGCYQGAFTDSRIGYAMESMNLAYISYQNGKREDAYKYLGQGLHSIQDLIGHGRNIGSSIWHNVDMGIDEPRGPFDKRGWYTFQVSRAYLDYFSGLINNQL